MTRDLWPFDLSRTHHAYTRAALATGAVVLTTLGVAACATDDGGAGSGDSYSGSHSDDGRVRGTIIGALPAEGISLDRRSNPAIARLDPRLRSALEAAARSASDDGITLRLTSGWRSASYQSSLFEQAVREYGSEAEARKWVASPSDSAHVRGAAVDVGPTDAAGWMEQHGSDWGLCRRYANEIWHYELLVEPGGTCPAPLADASAA